MASLPPYGYDPQNPQTYPPQQPYTPQPSYPLPPSYPQQPPSYPQQPLYPEPPAYPSGAAAYPPPPGNPTYPAPPGPPTYPGAQGMPSSAQPAYQAPVPPMMAYGVPMAPGVVLDPGRGPAITSLVLGIIGLVFSFIPVCGAPIAVILGIIGAIMGGVGLKSRTAHGMAVAGLVMSILALVISIGIFIYAVTTSSTAATLPYG